MLLDLIEVMAPETQPAADETTGVLPSWFTKACEFGLAARNSFCVGESDVLTLIGMYPVAWLNVYCVCGEVR
jgi:hypothetical protein